MKRAIWRGYRSPAEEYPNIDRLPGGGRGPFSPRHELVKIGKSSFTLQSSSWWEHGSRPSPGRRLKECVNLDFFTASEAGVQSKGLWQSPFGTDRPFRAAAAMRRRNPAG